MIRLLLFVSLITLAGTAFRPALSPTFASIISTWKRTGMALVEATSKITDVMAKSTKAVIATWPLPGENRV